MAEQQKTGAEVELFVSVGSSGLKRSGGLVTEEFHPRLTGRKAALVYREMSDNEASVGALLRAISSLVRKTIWTSEPADESDEAKAEAAFLDECREDMSHTWEDMVAEALGCVVYGFAPLEKVYKVRGGPDQTDPSMRSRYTDGKFGWRKIALRAQDTVGEWVFDEDGGVAGLYQVAAPTFARVFIPMPKLCLVRLDAPKNNPEGRSVLRSAYRSWYFLKRFQEIEATGVERDLVGFPVMQVPPSLLSATDAGAMSRKAELQDFVSRVRRDEDEGALVPAEEISDGKGGITKTGYKLSLLASGGSRAMDVGKIIERYERRIAMVFLADFLFLGQGATGSFALADSKTSTFAMALGAVLETLRSTFQRFLVDPLMELNGVPPELRPKLKYSDIEERDVELFVAAVTKLVDSGVVTADAGLEREIRRLLKLPPLAEDEEGLPPVRAPARPDDGEDDTADPSDAA